MAHAPDPAVAASPRGPAGLHLFVALLAIGTGGLDVIAVLAIGDAFASVMTGNLVLLGLALGTWSPQWAVFTGVALAGYVVGGLVGSAVVLARTGADDRAGAWPRRLLWALALELALLSCLAAAWAVVEGDRDVVSRLAVLAGAATGMGIQSAAVRVLPVRVSTTYLTGALTSVIEAVATRRRFTTSESAAVVALVGLVSGAALGAAVLSAAPAAALALPPCALALAAAVATAQHVRSR